MKVVSICLSDIPKEKITKSEKNGKSYVSIVVDDRREPDQYGNDLTVYVNQTKEERQSKTSKVYVGNGKTFVFNNNQAPAAPSPVNSAPEDDDLPF